MNGFLQDNYQAPANRARLSGLAKAGSGRHKRNRTERREIAALLQAFSWFDGVTEKELERLSDEASLFRYPANWVIAPSATVLEFCWFITQGTARVMRQGVEVGKLEPGDIIGEPALHRARATRTTVLSETAIGGIAIPQGILAGIERTTPHFSHARGLAWRELRA